MRAISSAVILEIALFELGACMVSTEVQAREVATTMLSTFCGTSFERLYVRGEPISPKQIGRTLTRANLSSEDLARYLASRTNEEVFRDLQDALGVRWKLQGLAAADLPQAQLPSHFEIEEAFPHLRIHRHSPISDATYAGFGKNLLEQRVSGLAKALADEISNRASPEMKREYFRHLISDLGAHDPSWYHQTRVDQVIDRMLGLQHDRVTRELQSRSDDAKPEDEKRAETYDEAAPSFLLTPYHELRTIFGLKSIGLRPGMKVVDLGAGTGRLGVYLGIEHPGVDFVGFEIVPQRTAEGRRVIRNLGLQNHVRLEQQDLGSPSFQPEPADIYYAFNPVSGETFDKLLEDLRQVGLRNHKRFKLILFGPAAFEKADAQPWLRKLGPPEVPGDSELGIYEFVPDKAFTAASIVEGWQNIQGRKKKPAVDEIPAYPIERRLSENDLTQLERASRAPSSEPSAIPSSSLPSFLVSWAHANPATVTKRDGAILIQSQSGSFKGNWEEPIGVGLDKKAEIVRKMLLEAGTAAGKRIFSSLSPEVAAQLRSDPRFVVEEDPHTSDYIYPVAQLAELSATKKLRDRANQVRKFDVEHPGVSAVEIGDEGNLHQQADHFLSDWVHQRETSLAKPELTPEQRAGVTHAVEEGKTAERLFQTLKGRTLRVGLKEDGKLIGLAMGEVVDMKVGDATKKVFVLYVQKTDGIVKNAVVKLNHSLVSYIKAHPERFGDVDYVNMMDDAGQESLRRMKKDYSPDETLGKSYRAYLAADAQ